MEIEQELEKIDALIQEKEEREKREYERRERKNKRWKELMSLSWAKQLQEPEFKEVYDRVRQNERYNLEQVIKKRHREFLGREEEMFKDYFDKLLNEEVRSINDYLRGVSDGS